MRRRTAWVVAATLTLAGCGVGPEDEPQPLPQPSSTSSALGSPASGDGVSTSPLARIRAQPGVGGSEVEYTVRG